MRVGGRRGEGDLEVGFDFERLRYGASSSLSASLAAFVSLETERLLRSFLGSGSGTGSSLCFIYAMSKFQIR